ncbi:hypothetical protein [Nocardia terpenica]|uniref:Uncharacterized protein n=1 Tax=Nocardia terpenica TaxID=455432 RepID=A0A6G9Z9U6_9NOCA|nr:hypothetical protein [Nocardia terpenica]QIS22308.1 hypothetical protein F6W96_32170 [Nocardia terpenica]
MIADITVIETRYSARDHVIALPAFGGTLSTDTISRGTTDSIMKIVSYEAPVRNWANP